MLASHGISFIIYGWNAGPISIFIYKRKEYCDQTILSNDCPKIYVKK